MNDALQALEVKVENGGATPQGKVFANEWNVLVEAVKSLDRTGLDADALEKFLKDKGFITVEGEQTINGSKDFVGGLKINGNPVVYNAEQGYWELVGDLIVSGAITMFGSSKGFKPSTIMDAVLVDGKTIKKNEAGQLSVIGSTGGTDTATVNALIAEALVPYIKTETADGKFALISTVTGIDTRLSAVETFFATEDSDTLVNKWAEIVDFLNATEGDTLDNILSTKANKATTLAGYGITDAYTATQIDSIVSGLNTEIGKKWSQDDAKIANWDTAYGWGDHSKAGYAGKTYVDTELAKYVLKDTAQEITAQHNFVNGFKIGGLPIYKSQDKTVYLDANLVVSGAITMFGSGSTTFPAIWENLPLDESTLKFENGRLTVIGGAGGGVDANAVNVLISEYLTTNKYATQSWVEDKGYITQHQSLSHLLSKTDAANTYLSKYGGTISGTLYIDSSAQSDNPLFLRSYYADAIGANRIQFVDGNNQFQGYVMAGWGTMCFTHKSYNQLGVGGDLGVWCSNDNGATKHKIIHSGNIGDYKAGSASKLTSYGFLQNLQRGEVAYFRFDNNVNENVVDLPVADNANGVLVFNRHEGNYHSLLGFSTYGLYFASAYGQDVASPQSWKQVAFTSDLDNYLPKSGGSLNGELTVKNNLYINSTSGYPYLRCQHSGTEKGAMGYDADLGMVFYNGVSGNRFTLKPSGGAELNTHLSIDGNVAIDGDSAVKGKFHIEKSTYRFEWSLGNLGETAGFGLEYKGSNADVYGLYIAHDYRTGRAALQTGHSTGQTDVYDILLNPLGGNVAVGGESADAKLHVHGGCKIDGNTIINGNLLTTGAITTKSLTIDGLQLYKSQDKTLFIDGNVVVSGAITMFGTNATQVAENLEQRVAELERKVTQLTA